MGDYLESRLGINEWLARSKTTQGKRFLYISAAWFIFGILLFIFVQLDSMVDWNRYLADTKYEIHKGIVPDKYYVFRPYSAYLAIFSLIGVCASFITGIWYYKHAWGEPMFADLLIPKKYARLVYMILGVLFTILSIIILIMTIQDGYIQDLKKMGVCGGMIILGILVFLYGYK